MLQTSLHASPSGLQNFIAISVCALFYSLADRELSDLLYACQLFFLRRSDHVVADISSAQTPIDVLFGIGAQWQRAKPKLGKKSKRSPYSLCVSVQLGHSGMASIKSCQALLFDLLMPLVDQSFSSEPHGVMIMDVSVVASLKDVHKSPLPEDALRLIYRQCMFMYNMSSSCLVPFLHFR